MSNLTSLEKQELSSMFKKLKSIEEKIKDRSDSFNDVVFEQITLSTSKDEELVLKEFMSIMQHITPLLEQAFSEIVILENHFIKNR